MALLVTRGGQSLYEVRKGSAERGAVYAGVWTAPFDSGDVVYIGWDWRTYGWNPPKDGGDWTEVLSAALRVAGGGTGVSTGAWVPQCSADGGFEPKQCSGSTGRCWCTTSDGAKIEGTEAGPSEAKALTHDTCLMARFDKDHGRHETYCDTHGDCSDWTYCDTGSTGRCWICEYVCTHGCDAYDGDCSVCDCSRCLHTTADSYCGGAAAQPGGQVVSWSCNDLSYMNDACPSATDSHSFAPDSCPQLCAETFVPWWDECSDSDLIARLGPIGADLQAFYELCQAGPPPPPPPPPSLRREYGARTCGYMDGIHTCSASAVQHRSVPSLDACKELCDSERGCSFVMVK